METILGVGFIASVISELAIITYSSLKKSNLAFLAPRILNSEIVSFAVTLDFLTQQGKKKMIHEKIRNFFWKLPNEIKSFQDLQMIENYLIQKYVETFDKFLFFLPKNLNEFLEEWKRLRDFENLKTLLDCVNNHVLIENCVHLFGPQGKISTKTLKGLLESKNTKEALNSVAKHFPSGTISELLNKDEEKFEDILFSIDRVAGKYVYDIIQKTKIENSKEIQNLIMKKYEIKDIITISRLKKYDIPDLTISHFLLGHKSELDEREIKNLVSARNYSIFYSILSKTYYSKLIPETLVNPQQLEANLNRSFFKELTNPPQDIGEELIIHFMISLEYCFPIVWRAIIFSYINMEDNK